MTPIDHDEPERDAWLSEALRHAPDADAAPPPALRETILREARAASAPPRRPRAAGPAPWLASVWRWLAWPPVAAGFASVMVATMVGLMWWDRPIDETLPRPSAAVSKPPTAMPMPQAVPADAGLGRTAAAPAPSADTTQAEQGSVAAAAPSPTQQRAARQAARSVMPPAPKARPAAPDRAPPAPFSDEPKSVAPASPASDEGARDEAAQATPSTRMRAPASAERADSRAAGAAAEAPGISSQADATGSVAARSLAKAAAQAQATSSAAMLAPRSDAAGRPAAWSELLASLAAQPQRWTWQRDGAAPQPMNPALQRWLAQLDAATASRWRAATATGSAPQSESDADLRLYRDGALQATLRLDDAGVGLMTPAAAASPGAYRAALPQALRAALKRALDDAAR